MVKTFRRQGQQVVDERGQVLADFSVRDDTKPPIGAAWRDHYLDAVVDFLNENENRLGVT